ncbi:unnamed protein product [marine sediment metagenome]|uniref:NusA-like second KH domain-containing protein n=1 Tax=marine sediment metagenome TaxID=412755 RepID=X1EPI4_9ZZZZ
MPKNKALAIVPEDQLSLAIGKNGQNVRLAAKLTGWKIDVRSQETIEEEKKKTTTRPPRPPASRAPKTKKTVKK